MTCHPRLVLLLLPSLVSLALTGCGPDTVTVGSTTLTVRDAVLVPLRDLQEEVAVVVLGDQPDLCRSLQAGRPPSARTTLQLRFLTLDASSQHLVPSAPGEFPVARAAGTHAGLVDLTRTDAACQPLARATATGGTLVASALSTGPGGRATGHFELDFGGERVAGDFDAPLCDLGSAQAALPCD